MYSVQLTTKWERTLVPVDGTGFVVGKWVKAQVPIVFDEPEPAPEPEPEPVPEPEPEPEPQTQSTEPNDSVQATESGQRQQSSTTTAADIVMADDDNIATTELSTHVPHADAMDVDPAPTSSSPAHMPGTDGMLAASHDPIDRASPEPKRASSPLHVSTSPLHDSHPGAPQGSSPRGSRAHTYSPSHLSPPATHAAHAPHPVSAPSPLTAPSSTPGRSPNLPMPPAQQRHLHQGGATPIAPGAAGLPPAPSSRPHSPAAPLGASGAGSPAAAAGLPPKPALRPPPPQAAQAAPGVSGLPRRPSAGPGADHY